MRRLEKSDGSFFDYDRLEMEEIGNDEVKEDETPNLVDSESDGDDTPEGREHTERRRVRAHNNAERLRKIADQRSPGRVRRHVVRLERAKKVDMGVDPGNLLDEAASWHRRRSQQEENISSTTENPAGSSAKCPPLLTMTGEELQDQDGNKTNLKSKPDPSTMDRPLDPAERERPNRTKGVLPLAARKVGARRFKMARGITVDSGAADNVMPRRMVRGKGKVRPSAASRAGVHYVSATAHRIKNEGEADLEFKTEEGHDLNWTFQIAEVNKVLASVSSLVDTRHRVVFDKDDKTGLDISFITSKATGKSVKMRRERNVWVIDAFVEEDLSLDFVRQE